MPLELVLVLAPLPGVAVELAAAVVVAGAGAGGDAYTTGGTYTGGAAAAVVVEALAALCLWAGNGFGAGTRETAPPDSATATVPSDGTVSFSRGAAVLSGCDLIPVRGLAASVTARCTTRLPVGTSRLSASFFASGDDASAPVTSAVESLTIAPASAIRLSLPTEPRVGSSITYRASVRLADARPARLPIDGTVSFADHGHMISGCGAVKLTHLHAGCRTRYAADGSQTITARYSGDHDFAGASSNPHIADVRYSRPIGRITAGMRWTFHYTTRYTVVQALRVLHVARASTIALSCHGAHCPFASVDRIAHHFGFAAGTRRAC